MRPGHIRVFDGLRITTEHMEHLQGALHSAVEDVRQILGLGRVFSGFEVVAAGDHAITVQPGLAFDFQRHRLVCDEPKTVAVTFAPEEDTQYVCVKYDQIEDGQVEGHFTLIWESCAVVLRPTLPRPEENLVPIAILGKRADGTFDISSFLAPEEEGEAPAEEVADTAASGETVPAPAESAAAPGPSEPPIGDGGNAEVSAEAAPEAAGAVTVSPDTVASPAYLSPARLRVRQGVIRLAPEPGSGDDLRALLLEPLRKTLASTPSTGDGELLWGLAEKEVAVDFSVASLTCHTIISGGCSITLEDAAAPATAEGTPVASDMQFQSTAQGEVTCADTEIAQFGVSIMQACPRAGVGGIPWGSTALTERGIAHLVLRPGGVSAEDTGPGTAWDILSHLHLLVLVNQTNHRSFTMRCNLLWKGGLSEAMLQAIEAQTTRFTWEALVAWKALGESQPETSAMH